MLQKNICVFCSALLHVVCGFLLLFVQVSVTVYPEHGLSDQHIIPWWIIFIAVLAGIVVLALLVCILWKVGVHPFRDQNETMMLAHTHP